MRELQQVEEAIHRASSLTPQSLIDAGAANKGDRLVHEPVMNRKLGRKPFEEPIVAEPASGERAGFRLIQGPEELKTGLYTSTGLLKEVYKRYGANYAGSGNAGMKFTSGESEGLTLSDACSQLRDSDD